MGRVDLAAGRASVQRARGRRRSPVDVPPPFTFRGPRVSSSRRDFLKTGTVLGGALGAGLGGALVPAV
ncbi:MAG: twin-arginine translocation signal domain-containing protein, partial [Gemmatirosa sp.]